VKCLVGETAALVHLPFNRILHSPPGSLPVEYSPDRFAALPLQLRVRYLLEGHLRFFLGSEPIPTAEALRALRAPPRSR
jgi:hypothetical protein